MINNTIVKDQFWNYYKDLVTDKMIPYQWNVLNDDIDINIEKERDDDLIPAEKSHAITNFKIAAGLIEGDHYGYIFQDSDLYKWLEAVSYSLHYKENIELEKKAIEMFNLIINAQQEDGYINTYFQIEEPQNKYKNLQQSHELYCYGHLIEAIVAFYKATKIEFPLQIANKIVNHLDITFGTNDAQIKGYDGHEEIERALLKLYKLTDNIKCLKLAEFFIFERGKSPNFFEEQKKQYKSESYHGMEKFPLSYFQAHKPVLEQNEASGHAVRQVYLSSAAAELSYLNNNKELNEATKNIWDSITKKKMYITGGIGSTAEGEAFTAEYDLPNDSMYCETCASVGLIFLAQNMFKNYENSEYINVLEKVLYNSLLSGVSLDGKHFFYVNPLEVDLKDIQKDPLKSHVKTKRAEWFGCACCPPNLARLLLSLEKYIYYLNEKNNLYINLFVDSVFKTENGGLSQKIEDRNGIKKIKLEFQGAFNKNIRIRVPEWADKVQIIVNGKPIGLKEEQGYVTIGKIFGETDNVEINFEYAPKFIQANPMIKEDRNKVALQNGPFIYCVENIDNNNHLWLNEINTESPLKPLSNANFTNIPNFKIQSFKIKEEDIKNEPLYLKQKKWKYEKRDLIFIPYFCWANRDSTEMKVWLNKR